VAAETGLTRNQALVLGILRKARHAMGAYEILGQTGRRGVRAPPQVYRALQALIERKLVHRIDRLNAFVSCDHAPHDHDVALAVCESCGTVTELPLPMLEASIEAPLARDGFAARESHVEIIGSCRSCVDHPVAKG
jgi:Fur family zinc uptake transcriptional regulator